MGTRHRLGAGPYFVGDGCGTPTSGPPGRLRSVGSCRCASTTQTHRTGRRFSRTLALQVQLQLVILATGRVLAKPFPSDNAGALGATTTPIDRVLDVLVLGAGPAVQKAAIYAASEGLSVLVIEPLALGGQASSSPISQTTWGSRPVLSSTGWATRAYQQAWTFGADFLIGRAATALTVDGDQRNVSRGWVGRASAGGHHRHGRVVCVVSASTPSSRWWAAESSMGRLPLRRGHLPGSPSSRRWRRQSRLRKRPSLTPARPDRQRPRPGSVDREAHVGLSRPRAGGHRQHRDPAEHRDRRSAGCWQRFLLHNNATGGTEEAPATADIHPDRCRPQNGLAAAGHHTRRARLHPSPAMSVPDARGRTWLAGDDDASLLSGTQAIARSSASPPLSERAQQQFGRSMSIVRPRFKAARVERRARFDGEH